MELAYIRDFGNNIRDVIKDYRVLAYVRDENNHVTV
jgi:hypothetical protein